MRGVHEAFFLLPPSVWNWMLKAESVFPVSWLNWRNCAMRSFCLGVQDHMEIWSSERWKAYLGEKQAHFDEIAEAAFGLLD